jgi:hypothetical protein
MYYVIKGTYSSLLKQRCPYINSDFRDKTILKIKVTSQITVLSFYCYDTDFKEMPLYQEYHRAYIGLNFDNILLIIKKYNKFTVLQLSKRF